MERLATIFVALFVVGGVGASVYEIPLSYVDLRTGAPIGPDGRVVDTAEVAAAKAQHAAAQKNERVNLANAAARSGEIQQQSVLTIGSTLSAVAPLGPDGRVIDTPEVAAAKAIHATAQANERINLANEAARSANDIVIRNMVIPLGASSLVGVTSVGPDGRILDTPEVAAARAAHAVAHINEKIKLANEAARSEGSSIIEFPGVPLLLSDGLTTSVAPIGPDGRVVDTAEVAIAKAAHAAAHFKEKANIEGIRSADVLATAGSAVAYGRLVY